MLFVEEGLGHNASVTATKGKSTTRRKEHSDVFTDDIHCGIVRRPKKKKNYLDIDVYVRTTSSS